ncbi:hypothetical protein J2S78_000147 [Salibacterium salarium]|uniref:hypothetical protein n=1 Tax=Salibacterium salarium TaxID=284579 RepID=UPI0027829ECF|nr:hypothetical protein [Salibacterium salarium]MDQ0297739.1 hypothetical protein [Salibacterium salarium]
MVKIKINTRSKRDLSRKELAGVIDKEHHGIYAYPHQSEAEREETRRLVRNYKEQKKKAKQKS